MQPKKDWKTDRKKLELSNNWKNWKNLNKTNISTIFMFTRFDKFKTQKANKAKEVMSSKILKIWIEPKIMKNL